jgi:hypothetical protein
MRYEKALVTVRGLTGGQFRRTLLAMIILVSGIGGSTSAAEPNEAQGISALSFSPDGKLAAVADLDGSLEIWDAAVGKQGFSTTAHKKGVRAVVFSPDGKWLLSAGHDNLIRIWEVFSHKEIGTLKGHDAAVTCLLFSPDGKELISGSSDNTVRVWSVADRKEIRKFKAHDSGVDSLGLTSDNLLVTTGLHTETILLGGNTIVSTSADKPRLWNFATGKEVRSYDVEAFRAAVSFDRRFLATSGIVTTITPPNVFQQKHVTALRDAATGKILVEVGFLNFFETITGKEICDLGVERCDLCTFSADGKRLACSQSPQEFLSPPVPGGKGSAKPKVSFLDLPPERDKWTKESKEADLAKLWEDLVSKDAAAGYRAAWVLAAMPDKAVPFLKERLKLPPAGPNPEKLRGLIADLDNDNFDTRQAASAELKKLRYAAEVALREAMDGGKLSLEAQKRVQKLLEALELPFPFEGEALRESRGLYALDLIGTPDALALIRTYADGSPTSLLSQDARRILERRGK